MDFIYDRIIDTLLRVTARHIGIENVSSYTEPPGLQNVSKHLRELRDCRIIMNSSGTAPKSQASVFEKVLGMKFRQKYFSSLTLENKLLFLSLDSDDTKGDVTDDVQSAAQDLVKIPFKDLRGCNALAVTVRRLTRNYQSTHSQLFNSPKRSLTFIYDYRRHALNAKHSLQHPKESQNVIRNENGSISELVSKSQEDTISRNSSVRNVGPTDSCSRCDDGAQGKHEKIISLENKNVESTQPNVYGCLSRAA
ncbi:unnamed protein product [Heterobilharzia americana]|nr:unnamed protein product [Heterobilharzia americana]